MERHMNSNTSGLYYKHILIVNYDSNVVKKFVASLTDNARAGNTKGGSITVTLT